MTLFPAWLDYILMSVPKLKHLAAAALMVSAAAFFSMADAAGVPANGRPKGKSSLKVMTFNIRYQGPADGTNGWPGRKGKVAATIDFPGVDAAGLQEALIGQIRDLESLLPGFGWIGAGREDGEEKGEFCPIFYRKSRLKPVGRKIVFWLSEEPGRPGPPGWDGACPRIVTVAEFEDLVTGRRFFFYNTHLDHVGEKARVESAKLILKDIGERTGSMPVVVTGDFNCDAGSEAYRILTSGMDQGGVALIDSRQAALSAPYGATYSFNAFSLEPASQDGPIDHILVGNAGPVRRWGIIAELWDGRFASDHFPVLAEIELDGK